MLQVAQQGKFAESPIAFLLPTKKEAAAHGASGSLIIPGSHAPASRVIVNFSTENDGDGKE